MTTRTFSAYAICLITTALFVPAAQAMDAKEMKMMDGNSDGMISKAEYMKHHEMMFANMKKSKGDMVDMKDMMMMQEGGTKGGAMMKDKPKSNDNMRK